MPPRRRKCRFYAFLLTEEKLLYGITPTLPPKGTTSGQVLLTRRNFQKKKITAWFYGLPLLFRKKSRLRSRKNNYRFRSVIFTSLDYQLFSAMRSSLRSERCRSELLLERSERVLASFFSFIFHMRLTAPALQMTFLRFPLYRGKAFIRHYADSIPKRHARRACSVVNALATACSRYHLFGSPVFFANAAFTLSS